VPRNRHLPRLLALGASDPPRREAPGGEVHAMTAGLLLDLQSQRADALIAQARKSGFLRSDHAIAVIDLARAAGMRYVVIGGRLDKRGAGAISALTQDESMALAGVAAVHARLGDKGAKLTAWLAAGTEEMQSAFTALMAELAPTEGAA
jgi:hypothetical protein